MKDSDLAGLKSVFGWASENRRIPSNPAKDVTIKLGKKARVRPKSFKDEEAKAILTAALAYEGSSTERPQTVAAKRWSPWLCAFTGARIGEIVQLRKEDVRREGDDWVIKITPEAGDVKTKEFREAPLHPQLVELGFPEFVQSAPAGALFARPNAEGIVAGAVKGVEPRP